MLTIRPSQSNSLRILLGVERLDARVLPAAGVTLAPISPDLGVAESSPVQINPGPRRVETSASTIDLVDDEASVSFSALGKSPIHVDPFGSKPGGTGEGIF